MNQKNNQNFRQFLNFLDNKISKLEDVIDSLEDDALEGKLDIRKLLETKEILSQTIRKLNKCIIQNDEILEDKELDELEIRKSHLIQLKEDLLHLIEINETVINKRISNTLNKLAYISMSFAPATFVAGLYGMNFQYGVIPPWNTPHGFLLAIIIIIIVTVFSIWLINYITLGD